MKPILVTGGAKGLGAQICRTLARSGHDLVIHYRSSEKEAEEIVAACKKEGVEAAPIQADFSKPLAPFIVSYLSRFPETKGIVHNVGNYSLAPPSQTEERLWRDLFETNFFAPVALTTALLSSLKRTKGAVVMIGTSGLEGALVKAAAYGASKSALLFYMRSLAKELAPFDVKVNMISPGFLENSVDLTSAPPLPMGRPGSLKEIADVVAFLFDAENSTITGQNLEIAGGFGL